MSGKESRSPAKKLLQGCRTVSDLLLPQLFRALEIFWVGASFPYLLTVLLFAPGGDTYELYKIIPTNTPTLIQLLLVLLLLWFYARNDRQSDAWAAQHAVEPTWKNALRLTVRSYPFWLFVGFWNLFLQWSPSATRGLWLTPVAQALAQTAPRLWSLLLLGLPVSLLYFLFSVVAQKRRLTQVKGGTLQVKPFIWWRAILHFGIWFVNEALIIVLTPFVGGFLFSLRFLLAFVPTLLVLYFFLDLFPRLRSLHRRKRFLSDLRAAAHRRQWTLTLSGHPLLSACFPVEGRAMLEENGVVYTLLLPPCHKRGVRVELGADGSATYCHEIKLRRFTFFAWQNQYLLTEQPLPHCFAVFTTVPHKVTANDHRKSELDNGSHYGFYSVYSGNAFLRTLDRDFTLAEIESFRFKP